MTRSLKNHDAPLTQGYSKVVILDWGIGGLGFYKIFRKRFPEIPVLYFSDSGFISYGRLSKKELNARLKQIFKIFEKQQVTHVVIACNAASTVLPGFQCDLLPMKVTGVIEHGVRAVSASSFYRIGVIGGARTIRSGIYRKSLEEKGKSVQQRIAQPLSAFIERGETSSESLRKEVKRILAPLKTCEALVLACTHYPAIQPLFEEYLPEAVMIDPVFSMLESIQKNWHLKPSKQSDQFLTTGDLKQMKRAAWSAFGIEIYPEKLIVRT